MSKRPGKARIVAIKRSRNSVGLKASGPVKVIWKASGEIELETSGETALVLEVEL